MCGVTGTFATCGRCIGEHDAPVLIIIVALVGWLAAWIVMAQIVSGIMWLCGDRPTQKVPWWQRVLYGNLTRIC